MLTFGIGFGMMAFLISVFLGVRWMKQTSLNFQLHLYNCYHNKGRYAVRELPEDVEAWPTSISDIVCAIMFSIPNLFTCGLLLPFTLLALYGIATGTDWPPNGHKPYPPEDA